MITLNGDLEPWRHQAVTFDLEVGGIGKDPWGNTKAGFNARRPSTARSSA